MAGRIQLIYDARARRAATQRSSIEVAGRVADHSCRRAAPIGPAREAAQHSLTAGGIQLVHYAVAVWGGNACRAALASSSVEVARRVADHSCIGIASIGPARETVQHRLTAGGIHLVYDTFIRHAAKV